MSNAIASNSIMDEVLAYAESPEFEEKLQPFVPRFRGQKYDRRPLLEFVESHEIFKRAKGTEELRSYNRLVSPTTDKTIMVVSILVSNFREQALGYLKEPSLWTAAAYTTPCCDRCYRVEGTLWYPDEGVWKCSDSSKCRHEEAAETIEEFRKLMENRKSRLAELTLPPWPDPPLDGSTLILQQIDVTIEYQIASILAKLSRWDNFAEEMWADFEKARKNSEAIAFGYKAISVQREELIPWKRRANISKMNSQLFSINSRNAGMACLRFKETTKNSFRCLSTKSNGSRMSQVPRQTIPCSCGRPITKGPHPTILYGITASIRWPIPASIHVFHCESCGDYFTNAEETRRICEEIAADPAFVRVWRDRLLRFVRPGAR